MKRSHRVCSPLQGVKYSYKKLIVNTEAKLINDFLYFYYKPKYEQLFYPIPAPVKPGKDHKLIKSLIKQYKSLAKNKNLSISEYLQLRCDQFFNLKSRVKSYSIGEFYTIFHELVMEDVEFSNIPIKGVIDGYRLALLNMFRETSWNPGESQLKYFKQVKAFLIPYVDLYKIPLERVTELYFSALWKKYQQMGAKGLPECYQWCTLFAQTTFKEWLENEGEKILPFLRAMEVKKTKKGFITSATRVGIMEDFILMNSNSTDIPISNESNPKDDLKVLKAVMQSNSLWGSFSGMNPWAIEIR